MGNGGGEVNNIVNWYQPTVTPETLVPEVTEDSLFAQEDEASRGETRTITKEQWKREFRITQ